MGAGGGCAMKAGETLISITPPFHLLLLDHNGEVWSEMCLACCCAVSMFCGCTKRGRGLPPPIVTHHPALTCRDPDHRVKRDAGLTIDLHYCSSRDPEAECDQRLRDRDGGDRNTVSGNPPPSWSWWQPGGAIGQAAGGTPGLEGAEYSPVTDSGVTTLQSLQHRNSVTVPRLLIVPLHY